MEKYAIIVAGGVGTRMGSQIPKQFLLLDDEPIIIKTIRKFLSVFPKIKIIVVLPSEHLANWDAIKKAVSSSTAITTVVGGDSRTASVMAGLAAVDSDGIVAIHDAVRPFVEEKTIIDSFESAEKFGSGVAAIPLKDSIREVFTDDRSQARDRTNYVLVQTPQTFSVSAIKEAYKSIGGVSYTDDATVFEKAGKEVFLVDGSYSNTKITTPEDLK